MYFPLFLVKQCTSIHASERNLELPEGAFVEEKNSFLYIKLNNLNDGKIYLHISTNISEVKLLDDGEVDVAEDQVVLWDDNGNRIVVRTIHLPILKVFFFFFLSFLSSQ